VFNTYQTTYLIDAPFPCKNCFQKREDRGEIWGERVQYNASPLMGRRRDGVKEGWGEGEEGAERREVNARQSQL
jgi:hypothetical protein